jgi:arylsulfatase A-like enzyme
MITRMDDHIGMILKLLKDLELKKRTIVFFCSDNGAANRYEGLFDSSGPLRGRKRDMYEGGLRTPMVVRWPGKVAPNAVSDQPWYFADFLPTAAALAGETPPEGLDGISVLPTLLGQTQDLSDRFLYWEFFERGFQQAVRWRDWKAIRPSPGAPLELYDLAIDIAEASNVATEHPDVVDVMESYLATARTESEDWPIPQ